MHFGTRSRPLSSHLPHTACRGGDGLARAPGDRPGADRNPHRDGQGRTGRRHCGRRGPHQLAGADGRTGRDASRMTTGRLRFLALPPGRYTLEIELPGFATVHETDILIAAGATIERTAILTLAGDEGLDRGRGRRARASTPDTLGSRRASAPRTSTRFRRGGRACSTSSGPPPASRRLRRPAASPTTHLRVRLGHQREPVPDRRHEHHLSVQRRRANRAGRRFHPAKCRSTPSARRQSSATCRAP